MTRGFHLVQGSGFKVQGSRFRVQGSGLSRQVERENEMIVISHRLFDGEKRFEG